MKSLDSENHKEDLKKAILNTIDLLNTLVNCAKEEGITVNITTREPFTYRGDLVGAIFG